MRPVSLRAIVIFTVADAESLKRIVVPPCTPEPATANVEGEIESRVTAVRPRAHAGEATTARHATTTSAVALDFRIRRPPEPGSVRYGRLRLDRRRPNHPSPTALRRTQMFSRPWLARKPSPSSGSVHAPRGLHGTAYGGR